MVRLIWNNKAVTKKNPAEHIFIYIYIQKSVKKHFFWQKQGTSDRLISMQKWTHTHKGGEILQKQKHQISLHPSPPFKCIWSDQVSQIMSGFKITKIKAAFHTASMNWRKILYLSQAYIRNTTLYINTFQYCKSVSNTWSSISKVSPMFC